MGVIEDVKSGVAGMIVEIVVNDYENVWRRVDGERSKKLRESEADDEECPLVHAGDSRGRHGDSDGGGDGWISS